MSNPYQEILEKALELDLGDTIIIQCSSVQEADSNRVSLNRTKKALIEFNKDFSNIRITRRCTTKTKTFEVHLFKVKPLDSVILKKENGESECISFSKDQDDTMERIYNMMREDGCSEEEIIAYRKVQENYGKDN